MATRERQEAKDLLKDQIEEWLNSHQDGETPFDCWIGDATVSLMADAAFAVIEAVEDAQRYLEREGHMKP